MTVASQDEKLKEFRLHALMTKTAPKWAPFTVCSSEVAVYKIILITFFIAVVGLKSWMDVIFLHIDLL